jgi:hypothetical protein
MTAIIGFQLEGQPVIFGDLLISGPVTNVRLNLPTVGEVSQVFGREAVFAPVSLTQKIAIIHDDFAVAWSGTVYLARTVIRELTERFSARAPTETELRQYLDKLPDEIAENVSLLVMVAVSPSRMYHAGFGAYEESNSTFGVFRTAGSGSHAVGGFLQTVQSFIENEGRQMTPFAKAMGCALTMSGQLLAREIFANDNLWEYFGGGYEVLTRVDGRWKKLEDVLTVFWLARQTTTGDVELVTNPVKVMRQTYVDDLLVIRALTLEGTRAEDRLYIVDPAKRPAYEWERQRVQWPEFRAKWICHQFVILGLDGSVSPRSRITFNENFSEAPIEIRWDGRVFARETRGDYFGPLREFTRAP